VFGSAILDVVIGIVFVYVLVSIICSAIREGLEAWLKTRAAYLERGIRELLHDRSGRGLAKSVYEHPLIFSLYAGKYVAGRSASEKPPPLARGVGLPSYIPAGNFATALMDIAARGPDPALASDANAPVLSLESMRANVVNIQNEPVQRVLLTAIDSAQGNLDRARQHIEAWYDSGMDRIGGWYKRSTQWILFWIGLAIAVGLNVNTITVADYLYRDDTARAAIVARAEAASADTAFISRGYEVAKQALDSLNLPIGWGNGWGAPRRATGRDDLWNGLFGPVLGWLLTAFAATMGAPFWFDLLNRIVAVRSTVKPRGKSPEEPSEDRQRRAREPGASPPQAPQGGAPVAPPPAATPAAGARIAAQPPPAAPAPRPQLEDACDIPITRVTADEDLPAAQGGVS
jgi:hypothetical protein